MLSPTFASPVNIQHVPTFARFRGQHVVNICSSRPPSDGLAQRTLKIKLERLKNRSKPPKSRSKSLDSSYLRPRSGLTGNIFNICKATGRVNIQHCCQHLQQMASTFNINSCGDLVNVFPHGYPRGGAGNAQICNLRGASSRGTGARPPRAPGGLHLAPLAPGASLPDLQCSVCPVDERRVWSSHAAPEDRETE